MASVFDTIEITSTEIVNINNQDKFLIKAKSGKWWFKKQHQFLCEYRPQKELHELGWLEVRKLKIYLDSRGDDVCDRHIDMLRFAMEEYIACHPE